MDEVSPEIVIYGECITSLKVANIYIGFKEETNAYRIRKIICEPDKIRVSLRKGAGSRCPQLVADCDKHLSVDLPDSFRLLPDTCSTLQPTPYGWMLRLNVQENARPCIDPGEKTGVEQISFSPKCRSCGNAILKGGKENSITNLIPLSQLGLPSDTQWDRMDLSYFCHEHNQQHQDDDNSVKSNVKQLATFVPKPNQAFIGHTCYILHVSCVEIPTSMDSTKTRELKCARCHSILGETSIKGLDDSGPLGTVHLYVDAVEQNDKDSCSTTVMLGKILKQLGNSCRRLCISLKDSLVEAPALFLWIMDWNLKMFKTETNGQNYKTRNNAVCKVLYKQESISSVQGKQWLSDSNVKKVSIHQSLLAGLILALLKSTENLPLAWQYANDFRVGYLEAHS